MSNVRLPVQVAARTPMPGSERNALATRISTGRKRPADRLDFMLVFRSDSGQSKKKELPGKARIHRVRKREGSAAIENVRRQRSPGRQWQRHVGGSEDMISPTRGGGGSEKLTARVHWDLLDVVVMPENRRRAVLNIRSRTNIGARVGMTSKPPERRGHVVPLPPFLC